VNPMALQQLTAVVNGELIGGDVRFSAIATDSRTLPVDSLFIALRGPNFDGHAFVAQAHEAGAVAVMVSQQCETALPQLLVDDTRLALGQIAAYYRQAFDIPLVAITGSNGKTTVKEMVASILGQQGEVLATCGNLNNDIGMPLTLMRMNESHHAAVIEMGANHAGEIAYLSAIAQPTVALITNAGSAHLEGFGSVEGVAQAKGEIFSSLGETGVAVINADDHYAPLWLELAAGHRVVRFGIEQTADVGAGEIIVERSEGRLVSRFELKTLAGSATVRLPLPGRHNVMNGLAATAAALAAGASLDEVCRGLEALRGPAGRLQLKAAQSGAWLLDDSYNANPASLSAGIEVLAALEGERWLVLGDMAELGSDAAALHFDVGAQARRDGIDRLFTVGPLAESAVEGFGEGAYHFASQQALIETLQSELKADVTLLIKGSRTARMERVVEALAADEIIDGVDD